MKEKVKALQVARQFDAERAGAQTPKIFEEGDDDEFMAIFEGWKPKQDRETIDLHPEVFDEEVKKMDEEDENEIVKSKEAEEQEELEAAEEKAKAEEEEALKAQEDLEKDAEEELEQKSQKAKSEAQASEALKNKAKMEAQVEEEMEANEEKAEEEIEKPAPAKTPAKAASKAPTPAPAGEQILVQKGARLACPKCGNVIRNMIREVDDRSHLISDYPIIYAKKYICGKCGAVWRRED